MNGLQGHQISSLKLSIPKEAAILKKIVVKMSMASLALVAALISAGTLWAGTVNITLPYLYTDGNMITYCLISNLTKSDNTTTDNSTTTTFKVMTTETGGAAQTSHTIASQYAPIAGVTRMLTFSKTSIYNRGGTQVVSLSDELPSGTLTAYTGMLTITSSTATCKTITMTCLQTQAGITEKRFAGYTCDDGTNVLAY